jgi:hypothetical protein
VLLMLKGSMCGVVHDWNNIETRAVIKFFFSSLQGKTPKEIDAILTETLGEHAFINAVSLQGILQSLL